MWRLNKTLVTLTAGKPEAAKELTARLKDIEADLRGRLSAKDEAGLRRAHDGYVAEAQVITDPVEAAFLAYCASNAAWALRVLAGLQKAGVPGGTPPTPPPVKTQEKPDSGPTPAAKTPKAPKPKHPRPPKPLANKSAPLPAPAVDKSELELMQQLGRVHDSMGQLGDDKKSVKEKVRLNALLAGLEKQLGRSTTRAGVEEYLSGVVQEPAHADT